MTKIIHMISGPRNLSTSIMYSFAQRRDTVVVDEPFYAHYLLTTGMDHPGREETIASQPHDPMTIQEDILSYQNFPVLFLKDMAHHLIAMDLRFLTKVENVFLIRNPKQLIASFAKVIPHPTVQDVGLKDEWELFNHIVQENGKQPIVVDSGELLKDPPWVLRQLCASLAIEFDANMLQWSAGARPEDGSWAKYWYANVHSSTGFSTQPTSERPFPDHCVPLYEEVLPYYQSLFEYAIKA